MARRKKKISLMEAAMSANYWIRSRDNKLN